MAIIKTALFLLAVILLAVRGGITVECEEHGNSITAIALTGLFGFTTAGMLVVTLLAFVANRPLLDPNILYAAPIAGVIQQSTFMEIIAANQDLWFSLPAILLLALGFLETIKE
jgi:hypothetical protein